MQFGVSFPHRRVTLDHGRNGLIERVLGVDPLIVDDILCFIRRKTSGKVRKGLYVTT